MADIKWIKLATDLFEDEKVLLMESLPASDSLIVIWIKLLTLAGKQNNGGVFMINENMPYTKEMFATVLHRDKDIVGLAIDTFVNLGMLEFIDNFYAIKNWEKHQATNKMEKIREDTKERVRKYRELHNVTQNVTQCNEDVTHDVTQNVTQCNAQEERSKKEEERSKIIKEINKEKKHKYGEYTNVLLSDEEIEKLKEKFPIDWSNRIEKLSSYMASTGKKYKSHYVTILNWARNDKPKKEGSFETDEFFEAALRRSYGQ